MGTPPTVGSVVGVEAWGGTGACYADRRPTSSQLQLKSGIIVLVYIKYMSSIMILSSVTVKLNLFLRRKFCPPGSKRPAADHVLVDYSV